MRFNGLDLNLLVVLDAILDERNITRAAERVFLSQSAMSSALGRLRDYFEDELVVRVGRQMVMTPLAESLVQPVRNVLLQLDATIATRPVFDASQAERTFSLLLSDYTSPVLMPPLLAHASTHAPGVGFRLRRLTALPGDMLERGDGDLLVIPEQWISAEHPAELLWQDRYVCLIDAAHPEVGEQLSLSQYLAMGHVAVDAETTRPTALDGWFMQTHGLARRVEVATPHFSDVPRLVVGTRRVALVQERLARLFTHLPLRFLTPPLPIPPIRQMMQWHKYRTRDPGLAWLRETLHATVGNRGVGSPAPLASG